MKKVEKKTEKGKVYDFRHLREEVAIGVIVDSDLSKTLANWIYQNTSEVGVVTLAFEIYKKGCAEIDDQLHDVLVKGLKGSSLKWSVKCALLQGLGADIPSINNLK
jgi:hypothetical protein